MKKRLRFIVAGVMALALVFIGGALNNASAQDAGGNGIKISPVRSDITISPGESRVVTMNVQNVTGSAATFEAIINDFVASGEAGQPALILDADKYADSHSLKRFISEIPDISLDSGESKDVRVTVTIPRDAAGGGYYGAVRFAPKADGTGQNVSLKASVGSIILVRVPGDIKNDMKVVSFDVRRGENGVGGSKFFTTNKDLFSVVRFENKGNVHEQPFGKVRLKQGDKVIQETEINNTDPRGNVLPDSVRRFDVKLDKMPLFGSFTVEGNFGYGDNGQLLTAKTSFFVLPLYLIIAAVVVLIVILALIFGLPKAIKKYNQNVIKKAGRR